MTDLQPSAATAPARRDFTARYLVESFAPLEQAAEVIAGEQSCGTFVALPGETADLKERARARVLSIEPLDDAPAPALPNAYADRKGVSGPYHRGVVAVSFPVHNVGPNLPNLYATVAGNLFELGEVTGLKVLDLDLPDDHAAQFPGPAFGVEGTRAMAGVQGRPVVGTIVKPSVGLSPEDTAALVDTLCKARAPWRACRAGPSWAPSSSPRSACRPKTRPRSSTRCARPASTSSRTTS